MEFNFEIETPDIDLDLFDLAVEPQGFTTRHTRPPRYKTIPESKIKYKNAMKMAIDMPAKKGMWHIALIDGTFIAGDFLEAFVKKNDLHAKRISISTLSLNQDNVDSLGNLLLDDWADEIDLIVSDGFWQNYRRDLIPYIYQELDPPGINRFQLAVARVHTKIILIETHCGLFITMRGSANLRSSATIEHIEIQESPEIFRFFADFHDEIVRKFKTINKDAKTPLHQKSLTKSEAWQSAVTQTQTPTAPAAAKSSESQPGEKRPPKADAETSGQASGN